MRASIVALALVGCLLSALGCGSAQAPASAAASAPVTTATAVAFAHAVNLRAGDLSKAEALGAEHSAPSPGSAAFRFARCAGAVSPAQLIVNVRSVLLWSQTKHQRQAIQSHVAVMSSAAVARRNLDTSTSRRGLRCARSAGDTSVSPLAIALPGGARAVGSRIARPQSGQVTYKDFLRFTVGPAEVVVATVGSPRPVALGTERTLLDVLYHRAIAARGDL